MLTPRFSLRQDEEFVCLEIQCRYIKTQEVEFVIDGSQFTLYARPYYLSLEFPHDLVEDGREKASYDIGSGLLSLRIPKAEPGQHFENLNLLTQLMSSKRDSSAQSATPATTSAQQGPSIEVLSESIDESEAEDTELQDLTAAMRDNFCLDFTDDANQPSSDSGSPPLSLQVQYGFQNRYHGVFEGFEELAGLHDLMDVGHPEHLLQQPAHERRQRRHAIEDACFDEDRYLADFMDADGTVAELCRWSAWWNRTSTGGSPTVVVFTEKERERMVQLSAGKQSKFQYMFEDPQLLKKHYLSLVTILYAAAYNHRTNTGDSTVESAWTIAKLSPTFSWFEHPQSLPDAVQMVLRRTLCFPLYRSWMLAETCLQDTAQIFLAGKEAVVKMLLEVLDIMEYQEDAWRLAKIWVEDYVRWVQLAPGKGGAKEEIFFSLGKDVERMVSLMKVRGDADDGILCKHTCSFGTWNIATLEEIAMDADGTKEREEKEHASSASSSEYDSTSDEDLSEEEDSSSAYTTSSCEDGEEEASTNKEEAVEQVEAESRPASRPPLIQVLSSQDFE